MASRRFVRDKDGHALGNGGIDSLVAGAWHVVPDRGVELRRVVDHARHLDRRESIRYLSLSIVDYAFVCSVCRRQVTGRLTSALIQALQNGDEAATLNADVENDKQDGQEKRYHRPQFDQRSATAPVLESTGCLGCLDMTMS